MQILKDFIKSEGEYRGLLQARRLMMSARPLPVMVNGLSDGAKHVFYGALLSDLEDSPSLLIVPDEKDCLRLYNALTEQSVSCAVYPMRDFMLHSITASHEYEQQRLSVLANAERAALDCVITTPDAAMQYTMPRDTLRSLSRTYETGGECNLEELCEFLISTGYVRVDTVDGVGQFSVRGGICDIFVTGDEYPHRMELFGDEIDSVGIFDVISQRRIENVRGFSVYPAREIIPDDESLGRIADVITAQRKRAKSVEVKKLLDAELDALDAGGELSYIDKYINVVYREPSTLLDYFTGKTIILDNPNGINERIDSTAQAQAQTVTALIENGEISGKIATFGISKGELYATTENSASITVDLFAKHPGRYYEVYSFRTKNPLSYADSLELLREDIEGYLKNRCAVILLCENETAASNYSRTLAAEGIESTPADARTFTASCSELYGRVMILYGCNMTGFVLDSSRLACLSLYVNSAPYSRVAVKTSRKSKKTSAKERIMSYADLTEGDYVVHDTHGIGLYVGMKTLTSYDGVIRDFLHIKYADEASLYVPCDRLEVLSKYIGQRSSDGTVRLNKMGGAEWGRAKTRVKSGVREMAKELIDLYARRMRKQGYAFSRDDDLQRQFEASFEYEETEGQLEAAADIKRDMQDSHPMDRLLCGDVGFGKTEVALRAAFKAATDGKQVAILVPTTILALQHYQTITSRMRGFPVNVELLSRFRSPKQQAQTLRRLRRGDADIIVGTHRLISKDVEFADLGLIIIDEEQRFGVAHKERLKQLCDTADVLTLTATPIPRTLNMAISGIRDMSILDEAPGDRMPPQTYVMEYDEGILAEAIRRELRRGGQVFYLYNSVDSINSAAARVSRMAPDATIAVAHGKMDKEELSDIWHGVVTGETDILVCTTIIETGVDVPNANTLIIENADRMGLSQLHQIRGRIGRSSRRSYAYLTYKRDKMLTEIAAKRLSAIREYTEFGSGFKIALRDLEIRGAGNLLGAEQHGHIESVGYDMYIKLLNSAVLEELGREQPEVTECTVDVHFSAYIPEKYIKSGQQRIEIYKKISHIQSSEDLDDIADELLDRFGDYPPSVENLLDISFIRAMGERLGIKRIEQKESVILIIPDKLDLELWVEIISRGADRLYLTPGKSPYITYRIKKGDRPLSFLKSVLSAKKPGK